MNHQPCSIEDCVKVGPITRGWCHAHYQRWNRHGNPLGRTGPPATPELPDGLVMTGRLLGRFTWHANGRVGDWWPDPTGTHNAYVYSGSLYCAPVKGGRR